MTWTMGASIVGVAVGKIHFRLFEVLGYPPKEWILLEVVVLMGSISFLIYQLVVKRGFFKA